LKLKEIKNENQDTLYVPIILLHSY